MQAPECPRDAHVAATHIAAFAEFVQAGIWSFGERLQQEGFLVQTNDPLPTTPMGQRRDAAGIALLAQQVLEPSFRDLEAFGDVRLGAFLGPIRTHDPNTQIHRVSIHAWPPAEASVQNYPEHANVKCFSLAFWYATPRSGPLPRSGAVLPWDRSPSRPNASPPAPQPMPRRRSPSPPALRPADSDSSSWYPPKAPSA